MMGFVDVRDVANAHLQAVLRPEAAGKRFLLSDDTIWFKDMFEILKEGYGDRYKINTNELSYWIAWVGSFFDSQLASMLIFWGQEKEYVGKRAREELGIDYIPAKQTILETMEFLIKNGYLK